MSSNEEQTVENNLQSLQSNEEDQVVPEEPQIQNPIIINETKSNIGLITIQNNEDKISEPTLNEITHTKNSEKSEDLTTPENGIINPQNSDPTNITEKDQIEAVEKNFEEKKLDIFETKKFEYSSVSGEKNPKRTRSNPGSPKHKIKQYNLLFYKNQMKSVPHGQSIEFMHKNWAEDYEELEDNHSYIQWLFPNFFQSMFNSSADPLSKEEAQIFREDPEIAQRLVTSYKMILGFYGCEIIDDRTGELQRKGDENFYIERYTDGLIKYTHNHLRMRRILMHLNNVGFRRYAIQLVHHWEKEIYGKVGGHAIYKTSRNSDELYEKLPEIKEAPLKKLANKDVWSVWKMYGHVDEDDTRGKELLERNCMMTYDEIADPNNISVYLKDLDKKYNEAQNQQVLDEQV